MAQRPFKILGIQQIAIGGPSKDKLKTLWVDMLGLEVTGNFVSERENVDEDICAMGAGPFKVEVDLMQPLDPEKKPAVHTTPLNHVGLWVDDLPKAVEWLGANGVRFAPGGIRRGAAGYDITFLHPKGNEEFPIGGEGVLVELVQAPAEVVEAFARIAGYTPGSRLPALLHEPSRPGKRSPRHGPCRRGSAQCRSGGSREDGRSDIGAHDETGLVRASSRHPGASVGFFYTGSPQPAKIVGIPFTDQTLTKQAPILLQ